MHVTFIGAGAIASEVFTRLEPYRNALEITAIVRSGAATASRGRAVDSTWRGVPVHAALPGHGYCDLLIEMAADSAVLQHVVPALRNGVPCFICSVGALAAPEVQAAVRGAAQQGGTTAQLMTGAIGALDALAAAAVGGLVSVHYTGRKPPRAWAGTLAEANGPLDSLTSPTIIFEGNARDAALKYPLNANVAATVALSGVGFDKTRVTLVADPCVDCNVHHIEAAGSFGRLDFCAHNLPSPDNPKTSAIAAWSVVRAVLDRVSAFRS
ncbi:aspartate dehydrogenase [Variovorax humicola]|uniref:L-aspartate dehydrogenase n=1 Tax=Variovorax humicola TaxID=1769758 RepID=A0ABU8VVZ6_9BURK